MAQAARNEIQRLKHLHQGAEIQLILLRARTYPSAAEQTEMRELKKRKLQLKDRIAWFESIQREHDNQAAE
jgi:hypothetical protein